MHAHDDDAADIDAADIDAPSLDPAVRPEKNMTRRARDSSLSDAFRAVLALFFCVLAFPSPAKALDASSSHISRASGGLGARQLLDHDASWFRAQMHGGAHNALDPGRDVSDQVGRTTCLVSDAFVRVAGDGKTFSLNGEPWVFAGWNQWEVLEAASDAPPPFRHLPLPGREHIVRQMNEAVDAGLKTMRLWAHTITEGHALQTRPGVFDEDILRGLDFVLAEAGKRGLKLILAMTDNWYPVGGIDWYVKHSPTASTHADFFTDENAVSLFLETHASLANRVNTITGVAYKNDPTIMAWNLANEPRCQGCDGDVMQAWIERTCAAFKKNAPNHLVGIGAEGFYGTDAPFASDFNPGLGGSDWAAREGQDFLRNAATPCVDYAGVHVWPDDWNFPGTAFQRRFLEQRIAAIQNALPGGPKPFVLEEFGKTVQRTETAENALNSRGGRTTPTRVRYFESAYAVSEAAANAGALAGTLFWHWYDRGVGPGKYGVRSNDDAFRAVEKHARAMNAIARVPESCAVSDENSDEAA